MYNPTHYYVRVSRAETFTGANPSLWVELPEVLDVPGILDGDPVLRLQACGTRPGDMGDPERALPHGGELVKPFRGEHPPQDEVTHLEGPGMDVVAVVPPQRLLVPRSSKRGLATMFLPQTRSISCAAS